MLEEIEHIKHNLLFFDLSFFLELLLLALLFCVSAHMIVFNLDCGLACGTRTHLVRLRRSLPNPDQPKRVLEPAENSEISTCSLLVSCSAAELYGQLVEVVGFEPALHSF